MRHKLLITGGNGFLARAVLAQIQTGSQVAMLVRAGTRADDSPYQSYEGMEQVSASGFRPSAVLHLAACIPAPGNAHDSNLVSANVDLVSHLVQAFPEARHVHASSVSVFGAPQNLPITVDTPVRPTSAYGLTKLAGECLVRQCESHAVIRFSSLVGIGMKPYSFIPIMVIGAQRGQITLVGDGARLQNYLAIEDAASMCLVALEATDTFVTLGVGPRSYRNDEVAEILATMSGAKITRIAGDKGPSFKYDKGSARLLGPCRHPLEDVLARMLRA
jgi:nucleoside-diphosphate-sugar epimerase